jgi:hypothetical protein
MSKQLVNLLGIVVVLAVLVAGAAIIALPLYGQSQATELQTREVTQLNNVYTLQVDQLTAEAQRIDEISGAVRELRAEIPVLPRLDDVYELVVSAAADAEAVVVSAVAGDVVAWTPRTVGSIADDGEQTDAGSGTGASAGTEAAAEPGAGDEEAADSAAAPLEDTPAAGQSTVDESQPQQQVPVVITVEVADATQAARFLDGLGAGPRLIGIESAVLTDTDQAALTLTVNALAFFRIGD